MIVAGVMSGTSADGIDVALVELTGRGFGTRVKLRHHRHARFPAAVRRQILAVMNATAKVADLVRLNFLLGELYADAVLAAQRASGLRVELIGCHGQTIFHEGEPARFLGRRIASTWQTGEGAVIAARCGVPVVSDFRVADMAAGGKGAPLVPFLDYLLYRDQRVGRIIQNLGGIANLTAIPAGAAPEDVIAFDTGPGNMVMDALAERLFSVPFDRNGAIAARGKVDEKLLRWALRLPYFRKTPPKTAGREQFGREFVSQFLRRGGGISKQDILATATALTARSITAAVQKFVMTSGDYSEMLVSGGGARNRTLMKMLRNQLSASGVSLRSTDELGLPVEAKEAVAFAVLAYETWNRKPSNLPAATGARRAVVLGKISYA